MDGDKEAVQAALARWRDGQFATLIVAAVQLAAMTHPELLRSALADVYDHRATERYLRHINAQTQAAADYAGQCRELCQEVSRQVADLEARLDLACDYLQRLREEAKPKPAANGQAKTTTEVKK